MAVPEIFLPLEATHFREGFGRRTITLRHRLAGNPLFSPGAIDHLIRHLPRDRMRWFEEASKSACAMVPWTFTDIEAGTASVCFTDVGFTHGYDALLARSLAQVRACMEPSAPGLHAPRAFINVMAPHAVTPFHEDVDEILLLQVRGVQTIEAVVHNDPTIASRRGTETEASLEARATAFVLPANDCLYLPSAAPHRLRNGPEVSVVFGVAFQTEESRAAEGVQALVARVKGRVERTRARGDKRRFRLESVRIRDLLPIPHFRPA